MFSTIRIQNLRGIENLTIDDFQQVNLFVGKNSCGKSTILESLFLLSAPGNPHNPTRINEFRNYRGSDKVGWTAIFRNLDIQNNITLTATLKNPYQKRRIEYSPRFGFKAEKIQQDIRYSTSSQITQEQSIIGYNINFWIYEDEHQEDGIHYNLHLEKGKRGTSISTTLKGYSERLTGAYLSPVTIEWDLVKSLSDIMVHKEERELYEILRKIDPRFERIIIGENNQIFCDIGLTSMLSANLMGAGFTKVLGIIVAIARYQNGILYIDELENGLHYSIQKDLWKAIFEAVKRFNVQIFISTHSYECIKSFTEVFDKENPNQDFIRLYRIEKQNNATKVIKYTPDLLKTAIEEEWEIR